MSKKSLISVSYQLPGDVANFLPFSSNKSLLDADVILFEPDISSYLFSAPLYQGKPSLPEDNSFRLKEQVFHWRQEIKTALEDGKTVFVFFCKYVEIWVHTGQKEFSGTGRHRVTTNIVEPFNNFQCLPFSLGTIIPKSGNEIKPSGNIGVLSSYWHEFKELSRFESYIDSPVSGSRLVTKTGDKTVGGVFPFVKGRVVLLPPIQNVEGVGSEGISGSRKEKSHIKKKLEVGKRLVQLLLDIDKAIKAGTKVTPPPPWVSAPEFTIAQETVLAHDIAEIDSKMEHLKDLRVKKLEELSKVVSAKKLLYEQGGELEQIILECLDLMGFRAAKFRDAESEFDAVFEATEGRCLGEAEGKDSSAVSIDKLSQLERNIQEDFKREEISEPAKGVLFGNAYRLTPVKERSDFFTVKCFSGAKRAGIALVKTPDLFPIFLYLKENNNNEAFKKRCREAILNTVGEVVTFPKLPENKP